MADLCCAKYENNSNKEGKNEEKSSIMPLLFENILKKTKIFSKNIKDTTKPQKKIWGLSTI